MIGAPLAFMECFLPSPQLTPDTAPATGSADTQLLPEMTGEMLAEWKAELAMVAWAQVAVPSMEAIIPDMVQDSARPGLIWYRFDGGNFLDDPKWFMANDMTAGGKALTWKEGEAPVDLNPHAIETPPMFSLLIKGYFVPRTTGLHRFTLESRSACYLWMGQSATVRTADKMMSSAAIALPGTHGLVKGSVTFSMTAGMAYPLSLMYGQTTGPGVWNMRLSFTDPASSTETTDGTAYYFAILQKDTVVSADLVVVV